MGIFSGCIKAQNLTISSVILQGDNVLISYDLDDEDLTHRYVIILYSSVDDYIQPLTQVTGDIGVDIAVGGNKQVIWNAKEELGPDFNGNVALEVKGKLYIPFVQLDDFSSFKNLKKDRPYVITWAAGRGSNVLTFDLYNSKDEKVHTFTNIANVGNYELVLPKDIASGKDYRFKISDQNNKEDIVYTPRFRITSKIPMYMKVAAFGAAGTIIYLLSTLISGGEGPSGSDEPPLFDDPILPN